MRLGRPILQSVDAVIDDEDEGLGVRHAPSSLPRGTVNCKTAP